MTNAAAFTVPLHQLALWSGNVRKTQSDAAALAELVASIGSVGVINPLTVFKRGSAFLVVAGSRRHAALLELHRAGRVPDDFPVPCMLTTKALAAEVSLAENAVREDMHPADEFEAFLRLSKAGLSLEDIGARFGCTPGVVARRLKLARVCPSVLNAYREGVLGLDAVMAYAVTDNARRQKKVFASLEGYRANDADTIRAALTDGEVDGSDRRVAFVSLEAYLQAGGTVRRDLFALEEDASGTYLLDAALLENLVADKLRELEAAARAEGWAWVESRIPFDYAERAAFKRARPEPGPLSEDLAAEAAALGAEREALYAQTDELTDEREERLSWIEARLDDIDATRRDIWPEDVLAVAGCIISIGHDGEPEFHRGLVRPADAKRLKKRSPEPHSTGKPGSAALGGLSASLTERLTRHRTAALAAEMSTQPHVALAAVVFTLAGPLLLDARREDSCLQIAIKPCHGAHDVDGLAARVLVSRRDAWRERLPAEPALLWDWCLAQDATTLLELLALLAGLSIDAVASRGAVPEHAHHLARALKLDIAAWFRPTAENYFLHVAKDQIARDIADIGREKLPEAAKLKKPVVAAFAERQAAESQTWVPAILRAPEAS